MSGFLQRLALRESGAATVLQPRVRSLFEPPLGRAPGAAPHPTAWSEPAVANAQDDAVPHAAPPPLRPAGPLRAETPPYDAAREPGPARMPFARVPGPADPHLHAIPMTPRASQQATAASSASAAAAAPGAAPFAPLGGPLPQAAVPIVRAAPARNEDGANRPAHPADWVRGRERAASPQAAESSTVAQPRTAPAVLLPVPPVALKQAAPPSVPVAAPADAAIAAPPAAAARPDRKAVPPALLAPSMPLAPAVLKAAQSAAIRRAGATPTVVQVTIGRLEVRALQEAPPRRQPRAPHQPTSLEEYLSRRNGEGRR